ncbi:MAG: glycosyl transferase [Actinomycetota bacterium]|nr:glycosyl transferase [Actinomycetota bacterium]MDG2121753.1 glycosyl transferase [Actinomycetota bacterium]
MTDFLQSGSIATLHDFNNRASESLEQDLRSWSKSRPISVIVPCLVSELERPALKNIVTHLQEADYVSEVIIGLDQANLEQFKETKKFFSVLPQKTRIIWNDGPAVSSIRESVCNHFSTEAAPGKGRNVWHCLGYFLGSDQGQIVALHDADIVTYDGSLLTRLLYPIAHPTFDYSFAKGFYYRASESHFGGRLVRLLTSPLIDALTQYYGPSDYLHYLGSFKYPLAGEFALKKELARKISIPSDWGLEIGVLSEIYKLEEDQNICQVAVSSRYDHKHQPLSPGNSDLGLHKMSQDILHTILTELAASDALLTREALTSISTNYRHNAKEAISRYANDSEINGFRYNREDERLAAELFEKCLVEAGEKHLAGYRSLQSMPNWLQVENNLPGALFQLYSAIERDNQ